MKKKEIKKISKKIFNQLDKNYSFKRKSNLSKRDSDPSPSYASYNGEETPADDEYVCEYDESVSGKFKKLFTNIIKYPDNLRLNYTLSSISIEVGDIKSIKKSSNVSYATTNQSSKTIKSSDDRLTIYILKDKYFSISKGYNITTKYKDQNMYNDLIELVMDKVKEINANNFNSIWEDISKESGILRDSNLDDILS
jgi:hypothetical protein